MMYARVAGYCLVALLHGIGFFLLYHAKIEQENQKMILLNFALCELAISIFKIFSLPFNSNTDRTCYIGNNSNSVTEYVAKGVIISLLAVYQLSLIHQTMDRFLDVCLHMRYNAIVTKKRTVYLLSSYWVVGILLGVTEILLGVYVFPFFTIWKIATSTWIAAGVLITLNAIVTYSYFLCKVRKVHKKQASFHTQRYQHRGALHSSLGKFKVPFLMVLTYILLNFLSAILATVGHNICSDSMYYTAEMIFVGGLVCDSFIYVFLQKEVRQILMKFVGRYNTLRKRKTSKSNSSFRRSRLPIDTNNNYNPAFIEVQTDIAMSVVSVGEYTEKKL